MKELRFIHISKTGGQAIANAAGIQHGLYWGMYDGEYGFGPMCHRLLSHNKMKDPSQYEWFTVVRNPYDRMISEYNWMKSTIDINEYINNVISNVGTEECMKGAHYTEQWRYIEKGFTIHVLHYENLEQEFDELMSKYGYKISLENRRNGKRNNATRKDLTLETIERINRIYEKDFKMFGYEMVHTTF
jgi:hypothetical protein